MHHQAKTVAAVRGARQDPKVEGLPPTPRPETRHSTKRNPPGLPLYLHFFNSTLQQFRIVNPYNISYIQS